MLWIVKVTESVFIESAFIVCPSPLTSNLTFCELLISTFSPTERVFLDISISEEELLWE